MADPAGPRALDLSSAQGCHGHRRQQSRRSSEPVCLGRIAPSRSVTPQAAQLRLRLNAKIDGVEISSLSLPLRRSYITRLTERKGFGPFLAQSCRLGRCNKVVSLSGV